MQFHVVCIVAGAILVASIESKPLWTDLYVSSYQYPTAINSQPQLLQYQDAYSPYYIYNLHTDVKTVPAAVLGDGKPTFSHFPTYNLYYGTPVYDFRFPLRPVYPVLRPGQPGLIPTPAPPTTTTTPQPNDENDDSDDGIEKLDTKVDPETETKKPSDADDSAENTDSITVEAI